LGVIGGSPRGSRKLIKDFLWADNLGEAPAMGEI
jgi:hypothetical protein